MASPIALTEYPRTKKKKKEKIPRRLLIKDQGTSNGNNVSNQKNKEIRLTMSHS